MEFIIIAVFVWAAKGGWDHLKADYGRSRDARIAHVAKTHPKGILPPHKRASVARQHASGYWIREALHGFPVYRTGMHSGWIAHKTARVHAEGKRAEAKTTHAETTASVRRTLAEQVQRQREAAAEAEAVWETAPVPVGKPRARAQAVADLAEARRKKEAVQEGSRPHAPLPSDTVDGKGEVGPALPTCYVCQQPLRAHPHDGMNHLACAPARKPEPGPYATRRPDGKPETEADKRFFGLRESGYEGPIDQDGNAPAGSEPGADASSNPNDPTTTEAQQVTSPATRGTTVADTTYDSAMARSAEVGDHAEGLLSDIKTRREEIEEMADDMQGSGVGARTVSAAMDAVDLWGDAEKALIAAGEGEENFAKALQSHYSELNEATQNAPDGAADPSFHEG